MNEIQERWYQEEAVDALFEFYQTVRKLDSKGYPERKNALVCLPTGTGKSIVIAKFIKRCFDYEPRTKFIMSTHVKELIKQNASKLQDGWPLAPLGIFSSGLSSRDYTQPIIFGGVQSMAGKLIFGHRDFLIIDEAHLVGNEGRYLQLIQELLMVNPFLKIIGLTATPYRMGLGLMTNGQIFTDIVYNLCNLSGFARLIAEGFLCPLIIPATLRTQLDVSNVGFANGDYIPSQLEAAVDKRDVNYAALSEYLQYAYSRRSGLIFASSVGHAEHIAEMMQLTFHQECAVLHSKKTSKHNDEMIEAWKGGEIKHAVNMNMLTTGVDNPMLDIIADLQPTMSTGKHVQKYGRGTRPFEGKSNCLVCDFAGNTRRLGPINDPVIPRLKGEGPPGDAPIRICPNCGVYNHASVRFCIACGVEFDFTPIINRTASNAEVMTSDLPQVEMIKVNKVVYAEHVSKASGLPSIKIAYYCANMKTYYEYKSVESKKAYSKHQAFDWFRQIYGEPFEGMTNKDVLNLVSRLRAPSFIRVWMNAKPYPQVIAMEF